MSEWTYLDTRHRVPAGCYDRNQILLDGGRGGVTSVGNILQENGVDRRVNKGRNGLWNVRTGNFEGDIATLFEVDAGECGGVVGFSKKLLLQTIVTLTYDMVPVLPNTITDASSLP